MKSIEMVIHPNSAKVWLERKGTNRKLSDRIVAKYAQDMTNGCWEINGESIKFSGDVGDGLVDGQHRLAACVLSGKPFTSLVVWGITDFKEIDIGKSRSIADAIQIFSNGASFGNCAFAIDGAFASLLSYAMESKQRFAIIVTPFTHNQRVEFILKNQELKQILPEAQQYLVRGSTLRPATALALLWVASFSSYDRTEVHEFLQAVRDGVDLRRGHPALAYRNFLLGSALRKRIITNKESFRAALSAIVHCLDGTDLKTIQTAGEPKFPGVPPSYIREKLGI